MSDFDAEKYVTKPNRLVKNTVSSNYTLSDSDSGGVVIIDSSSNDVTVTIPSDTTESIAIGSVIWLYRDGANFAIVRGESGVTLNPDEGFIQSDKTEIYIRKQAANEWVVGDLGGYTTSIAATGGTVSDITVGGVDYRVHAFTTVGTSTFEVTSGGEVEYLVVAGGGGGGNFGGGGGAGGYRSSVSGEQSGGGTTAEPSFTVSPGTYVVTVGSGGTKGSDSRGTNGTDSSFASVTSLGGGGGGGNSPGVTIHSGRDGGSGGGESQQNANGLIGEGTAEQGFDGGQAASSNVDHRGGGGGGAGQKGFNATPGNGGDGVSSTIDGTATFRAGGGGGGGSAQTNTVGGAGGGGDYNTPGAANTGGGGGANNNQPAANANGGSGIVIIRYQI